jgi:predicted DNA-binding transcriptional regulator YafY
MQWRVGMIKSGYHLGRTEELTMPNRLERLVAMEEEINRGRYPTVERFCEMFEVKARTVYEDIRYLKENMGLEVAFDRFRDGYYNANPKKKLPQFQLTDGEVFALTLGKEMLSEYTGTSFEPILRAALEKIYERLPNWVAVDLDDLKSMVKFNAGPVIGISRKTFLDLNAACEKHSPAALDYYSPKKDEITQRIVEPHRLMENRGTWYLVAYCRMRQALRLFALHRIRSYKLLDETFTPTSDEQIDEWLGSAFMLEHGDREYRVKIHFNAQAARYIGERQWHPSQELQAHNDGSCTLSLTTQSLDEMKRWVLTYGAQAEVIEPKELREMIEAEVKKMGQLYK